MDKKSFIESLLKDKKKLFLVFSRLVPVRKVLEDIGYSETTGNLLCPMHQDTDPSARIYNDEDMERLYCYACNKQYTSYHIAKKYNLDFVEYLNAFSLENLQAVLHKQNNVSKENRYIHFDVLDNVLTFIEKLYHGGSYE